MRTSRLVIALSTLLAITPLAARAAGPDKSPALHATTGTVKSVNASTLVITRTDGSKQDLSFTLNPSTRRDGSIVAGAPVSVRYQDEGRTHVATAVAVRPASNQTAHK